MKTLNLQAITMASARIFLSAIFILSGFSKLGAIEPTQVYMQAMGMPSILLWPTIVLEIGAGFLVILGFQTRISAFLLAGFSLITAVVFHNDFTSQVNMIMFLKNISMTGGFLLLAAVGPGLFSIDKRKTI
ncbi:DoxX family protein [Solimicrobium silvestre]|uniref:Putative membrane protein n=1 Tax=Solimicrobium silvestre TaxID=2099400 RepID=A0A2S9H3S7_9BURK|nr:DoxX family protein [Solimicrobium silvestre]PRC94583.1 putative membrane protein [Solimicrobium silvestre]